MLKKVGVISLGCPKNLVDTENLLGRFVQAGYVSTPTPEEADLLVVNTCGFIAEAEAESRQAIAEMAALKVTYPGKKLLVTGCLAQRYGASLVEDFPSIDLLTGTDQGAQVIPWLQEGEGTGFKSVQNRVVRIEAREPVVEESVRVITTPAHTAYVKIAEGCDNPCTFCIIPQLKGAFRSRSVAHILSEVEHLVGQGVREINLVSQDSSFYGRDLTPRTDLAALLERLSAVDGLVWLRVLYLYPSLVTDRLLQVMASNSKIIPYLDVPFQHSHPEVLKRMQRYSPASAPERVVQRIRERVPQAVLRSAFIVGFPGESKAEFKHLLKFISRVEFDRLGVFLYSDEASAASYLLPDKVPRKVAKERRDRLMKRQQKISRRKLRALVGSQVEVLVDGPSQESEWLMVGRLAGQAPEVDGVVYFNRGDWQPGERVQVAISEAHEYDLVGTVLVTVHRSKSLR
ncbi:MAG: 30S ribosomal protein S12 methylthiotransferase RimO [Magnetococcus sp. DMHC-6]